MPFVVKIPPRHHEIYYLANMYFILSKVLLFLIYPLVWIVVLLIIGFITKNKKHKKRIFIATAVLFYIMTNSFLFNHFARMWDIPPYPPNNTRTYSCGIVLGGFVTEDKDGNGHFNSSADRFIQGIRLLSIGKISHLLITGGSGSLIQGKFREGDWVRTQLKEFKYPDSSIFIESNSRNTIENATLSKPIIQKAGLKPPYLLITSAFHMRRAMMIFKKEGYNVDAYPCDYIAGTAPASFSDLIPDIGYLQVWTSYLKEVVGYAIDYYKK